MRLARLIGPELETLIRENPAEVRELLEEIHPEDIADVIGDFDDERAMQLLVQLPTEYAAQVFERLDEERQALLAKRIDIEAMARIALEMDADERADFFGEIETRLVKPLLQRLEVIDPEAAADVTELTRWPTSSAGGLMTTDLISVPAGLKIAQVISEVRKQAQQAETVSVAYMIGQDSRLVGVMSMRDLLMAEPSELVDDVMRRNVISVPPELDQEEVAHKLAKYDLDTLPVVSDKGVLLGVITSDDILDVLTEEQSEDVHKMGAVEPIQESYFGAPFGMYLRKRAPWLLILFVGGYFTASAMRAYDDVLASVAQLAFYVPLLVSAGGNSGSQSSTLVIRGLAVGDISVRDWWKVLVREFGQGLVLGLLLALFGVLRVVISGDGAEVSVLIACTIVAIVVMGCVIGGMMPIVLTRLGLDPATSSTPFIATIVDVVGIVVYLALAQWLLSGMLTELMPH